MVLCYFVIYAKVITARRRVGEAAAPSVTTTSGKKRKQLEMHVTMVSLVTCAFYLLMYLPMSVFSMSTRSAAALRSATSTYLMMFSWIGKMRRNWFKCLFGSLWLLYAEYKTAPPKTKFVLVNK